MHLIVKQSYRFKGKQFKDSMEPAPEVHVTPSAVPQFVPDFAAEDPLFDLARRDGSITKLELLPVEPAPEAPAPDPPPVDPPTGKGRPAK